MLKKSKVQTYISFVASSFGAQMQKPITIGAKISTDVTVNECNRFSIIMIITVNLSGQFCRLNFRQSQSATYRISICLIVNH